MRSYKEILLSGEYVVCENKITYDDVLSIANSIVYPGRHPNGNRFFGIVVAFANPWLVKVLF